MDAYLAETKLLLNTKRGALLALKMLEEPLCSLEHFC
jgi:hypothetical protein